MCCSPQPIAPAPPMMSIGLDALFELLAATTTPIASVVAPIALTTDPRKLLVSNCLASASARGDDWTSFSTSNSRNQPTVPSTGPSAPRMMSALHQLDSNRSAWPALPCVESADVTLRVELTVPAPATAGVATGAAGWGLVCAPAPNPHALTASAKNILSFICPSSSLKSPFFRDDLSEPRITRYVLPLQIAVVPPDCL